MFLPANYSEDRHCAEENLYILIISIWVHFYNWLSVTFRDKFRDQLFQGRDKSERLLQTWGELLQQWIQIVQSRASYHQWPGGNSKL